MAIHRIALASSGELLSEVTGRIADKSAVVGVVGLGYVGLPLAVGFAQAGFQTLGHEIDPLRLQALRDGRSYIEDLSSVVLQEVQTSRKLVVCNDSSRISEMDAIVVCLPTPLGKAKDPDLGPLTEEFARIASRLRRGQVVILSSTTYPGTTQELVLPILETSGLQIDHEFYLAFSPERIDPGNRRFPPRSIPRIVGGVTASSAVAARALLECVVDEVVTVSNAQTAELVKLLENSFRSINIAFVNEMAIIARKLGLDIWEVIDAAATKPYGFMRFEPGPGLGGHCIPVDPMYLSWKLRVLNYRARFVELADDINRRMPEYVAELVMAALNERGIPLKGASVLAVGLAYKPDVADVRESPSIDVIKHLVACGARVKAHDPYVTPQQVPGLEFIAGPLNDETISEQDCVLILTHHSSYDWQRIVATARFVIDSRGVTRRFSCSPGKVLRL